MRKKTLLSVSLALMLMLTACGGSEAAAGGEAPTETATTAETSEAAGSEQAEETEESEEKAKVTRDSGGLGGDEEESDPNLPYYVGPWKFDKYGIYLDIGSDDRWNAYNARGEVTDSGDYYDNGDSLTMVYDGDSDEDEYTIEDTGLVDQDGNTLSKVEKMIFLPTKADPLNMTVSFNGAFKDVTVNYPDTLTAADREGTDSTKIFQPTIGAGTGDARCSIQITHSALETKSKRLQSGSGPAKVSMVNILNNVLYTDYKDHLLKVISTDFKDCGTYYSITGYTWFDSTIFKKDDGKLYKGACEVRYYGPTGYCVVIMTIAPPERVEEYHEISRNIMDTYSYKSDWTTSPKSVPKEPGKPSGKNSGKTTANSGDSGDYGTAYYWTDSDGDIWYWNGSYNEFVSYGSNGYIDDDGSYYESNDAGWDDEDDYYEANDAGWSSDYYDDYDVYSDPGDGNDAWSDPGDYYEESYDYSYDDSYDDYVDSGYDDY